MIKRNIDELLSQSSPGFTPSLTTEAALDSLVLEARTAAIEQKRTGRRNALWLVPGTVLGLGALTAGALAVGMVTRVEEPIAIEYRTDTGVLVSCTATVESSAFTPNMAAVTEYYETHDFADSGLGQRIYEYALVLAGDKVGTAADLPLSVAWLPDETFEPYDDGLALASSLQEFLIGSVELELGIYDAGRSTMTSDCTGQLH